MHGVMVCSWGKNPGVKSKFLISITVFNKFQTALSSGSVKCRPLAIMLQWKQTHLLGVTLLFLFFPDFPLTFQKYKNNSFTISSGRMYGPTVIGRDHQNKRRVRKRGGRREMGDRRVYKARGRTRAQCKSERKTHQRGSRPTAICPDKDADSSSERGELVYH